MNYEIEHDPVPTGTHNLSRTCFGRGMMVNHARFHVTIEKQL
ncbi:hypothetical protein J2X69_002933 [Algoriphagus sp. 4150]|nr:hypothetical protein [Algoriphagus sp. 4150]MDR7130577.1 hypothetical protein [Algoriphagus sp. 4150]